MQQSTLNKGAIDNWDFTEKYMELIKEKV